MNWDEFDWLIDAALSEDRARDDVTTGPLAPSGLAAEALVQARADGVICGLPLAERLVRRFDGAVAFEPLAADGDPVRAGQAVARLRGPARAILSVERTMLNFLQRLSGIATLTARYVAAVSGTGAAIYDTRKTTPGWRRLEKYAVRCGGGRNHRMDLAEQALIKDNHLALLAAQEGRAEAVACAVAQVRAAHPGVQVEVEVENLDQLAAAVAAGADLILLDNMTPERVKEAAALAREHGAQGARPGLEASGSINLGNARAYAEAGADRVSIGALTHSAPAFDLSLEIALTDGSPPDLKR